MPTSAAPPIAIRVDAHARSGVGHVGRMVALAEELLARGHRVRVFGTSEIEWADAQLAAHGLALEPPGDDPEAFARRLGDTGITVCVLDGYDLDRRLGALLDHAGVAVAAMADGEFGLTQDARLYIDQNLGAVARPDRHPHAEFLVGPQYVLLRDEVLRRRRRREAQPAGEGLRRAQPASSLSPSASSGQALSKGPRVLVVFGGTDPFDGCVTLTRLLLDLGLPVEVVAVAARRDVARRLLGLPCGPGQTVEVHPVVDDLPGLAVTCDAAVSASGSSTWELACLGVPTALVAVTDNQLLGYREATRELCLPAGQLSHLEFGGVDVALARASLRRLVEDAALRHQLGHRASRLVDGRGRERVADALEALRPSRGVMR